MEPPDQAPHGQDDATRDRGGSAARSGDSTHQAPAPEAAQTDDFASPPDQALKSKLPFVAQAGKEADGDPVEQIADSDAQQAQRPRVAPAKDDCALVVAFGGQIPPPEGAASWESLGFAHVIRVPAEAYIPDDDLRAYTDVERCRQAWEAVVTAIDAGVDRARSACRGVLHLFAACPYPAGVYLGQRLRRTARDLPLVIYQRTVSASAWDPFLFSGDLEAGPPRDAPFFETDTAGIPDGGPDYVVSIEVARFAQKDTLVGLARDTGAGWIHRLTPATWRTVEPGIDAATVHREILARLDEYQRRHPQRRVHLVISTPLALAVAVGRMFNRNVYREVVVHDFSSRSDPPRYYPVLEIVGARVLAGVLDERPESGVPGSADLTPAPPDRPLYSNDGMPADDSLGMQTQAEDFARLIAARDVEPPLAIGLFGEWGVGKSYFMRCMRDAVDKLVKMRKADDSAPYVKRVVPIEFNAWHYSDTNLWAVLAVHIFEKLAAAVRPGGKPGMEERDDIEAHTTRLRSSETALEEAERRIEIATRERENAAKKLGALESERKASARAYGEAVLELWRSNKQKPAATGGAGAREEDPLDTLKKLAGDLGLAPVLDTADDVLALADRIDRVGTRAVGSWGALFKTRALLGFTLVLLATVVLVESGLLFLDAGRWASLARLVEFLGVVAAAAAWMTSRVKRFSELLDRTTQARSAILKLRDDIQRRAKDISKEEAESSSEKEAERRLLELARWDAELERETQRVAECGRAIEEAQRQILHIRSGGVVYDFLSGRIASSTYRSHLGLLSTIREDFKELQRTLEAWRRAAPSEVDPIDRIVLYVDDLDRCQPDQVVRVLQAVHLLLAFKLFVVVVAVDARWLQHSLRQTFVNGVPRSGAGERAIHHELAFSPQNYLEKIFQVPFALEDMSEAGYRTLIEDLNKREGEKGPPEGVEASTGTGENGMVEAEESIPGDEDPGASLEAETKTAASPDQGESDAPEEAPPAEQTLLALEPHEVAFLQELHPFIRTPRTAKRMLNIYRIIRVSAGRDPDVFARFIDKEQGAYRAVLTLLGIIARFPETGCALLRRIHGSTGGVVKRDGEETADGSHQGVERTADDLETYVKAYLEACLQGTADGGGFGRPGDLDSAGGGDERERILDLTRLEEILEHLRGVIPVGLEAYRPWARVVGRHSFNWNILHAGPGGYRGREQG